MKKNIEVLAKAINLVETLGPGKSRCMSHSQPADHVPGTELNKGLASDDVISTCPKCSKQCLHMMHLPPSQSPRIKILQFIILLNTTLSWVV